MRRREFLLSGLAATSVAAEAQERGRLYRLIVISSGPAPANMRQIFARTLQAAGFSEGYNLRIEPLFFTSAGRLAEVVAEAVRSSPDVIFANAWPAVRALQATGTSIPTVAFTADPIGLGLTERLSRPSGNVTGVAADAGGELWGKRLAFLKEISPGLRTVFHIGPAFNWEGVVGAAIRTGAQHLHINIIGPAIQSPFDEQAFESAFKTAVDAGAEAAIVDNSGENVAGAQQIVTLSQKHRIPTVYPFRLYAERGGLIAYDPDLAQLAAHAASQIATILRGTPPDQIPFYQPTRFRLALNRKTAEAIGLVFPPILLALADEVIE